MAWIRHSPPRSLLTGEAHVKSKAPLATHFCRRPFSSNVRKSACQMRMRTLEVDHCQNLLAPERNQSLLQ
jgi:hypothetical protein